MGYSRAVKVSALKQVLPPVGKSISVVSQEMGINDQTIRNWIKQIETGTLAGIEESSPRVLTVKEKYQLIKEAAGIGDDDRGSFLRERGLHSEHLTLWDQELRELMDKKSDKKDQELKVLKKRVVELEKDLQRKEKALAETVSLLVLKKKLGDLMRVHEDA